MDMFNKLKSAVSSALPGNPLSKDFEVYGQIGTAGPGLLWKIYSGMKRTTKQDAAIFLFEKKSIEKYSRRDKELILEALRRGASQLTRLRHPKILSVMQPLEESRECLAFATEPVLGSLANVLGNHDNLPEAVAKQLKEHQLYDVEIKYGLLQVTEGVKFLHQDAKLLHNNICPENIIVNKNGSWKLAGFDFCIPNKNPPDQAPLFPYKDWDPDVAPCAQPNLDYMAPEYAISESCSLACDMFSIGMLIYTMFNNGKPLYECRNQWSSFKKNAEELRKWRGTLLGKIPSELRDIVKLLFNTEPTVRPDPDQLAKISFFDDVGSMTLQYMDSLFQQDNLQKSKFFKGLPKIVVKFPKRVNLQRVLPPLVKECVNPEMIPFVLPNILQIAEQASDKEYTTLILPELIPMFKITSPIQFRTEYPIHDRYLPSEWKLCKPYYFPLGCTHGPDIMILLIFMQNMNLLLKKTPANDIKTHVLPMIYKALESDNPQIQELCLSIIPTFAELIDYTSLKTSIVPRIKKLCLSTNITGVRVNCLLSLGKLLEAMDKWFVLDEVLPLLPQIPSREPAVLMSILGIYKVAFSHDKLGITKDILAGKVVPFLMTVSIEHSLNLGQFTAFITLIREMITKIETEHRGKLEQLEQMKQEQKNMEITKITEHDDKTLISGIEEKPKTMMDSFLSGFGMGSGDTSSSPSPGKTVKPSQPATSQPAKVTLSLEEKQRIAKQQEQQRFLKAAKPLDAKSSNTQSQNRPKTASNQPKDLTSSLMQSNMSGLSLSSSKPTNSLNVSMGMNSSSNINSGTLGNQTPKSGVSSLSMGYVSSMNQGGFGSSGASSYSQNSYGKSTMAGQGNKPVDLSSFDNLMTSSSQKPKVSMSQMGQTSGVSSMQQTGMMGTIGNQGMMGNQGMIGNQGMMGSQGIMGQQSMMGNQGMMNSGFGGSNMSSGFNSGGMNFQQGGMGYQGGMMQSQPMGGQNLMQPQTFNNHNAANNVSSARNDLDDLFG